MDNKNICNKKQVERYLLNQMTEEEETLFQEHLIHCEACRSYMTEIRRLASIVGGEDLYYIKTPSVTNGTVRIRHLKYWLSVGACLLLLIGISIFRHERQQTEKGLYPTSIEYRNRASNGKADIKLLFPDQDTVKIKHSQPVLFKWDSSCSFHLKVQYEDTTLFDVKGNGMEYSLPVTTLSPYPYITWDLTVDEQSYSGQILFSNK
ncbi:anti-sigma factor [uncultured Parabacteroides sp.]|uniref:anti-sigma factor family protein n=1 Tax=uncultured Parabacteroides sp. TaxID=512312 RepID=UPI0025F82BDC|nr:zf-HC2 domain-containing protein [uncultured Parabacteroides sp.]